MFEAVCISFALLFGLAGRYLGMPPLVGFLCAGFVINAFAGTIGIPASTGKYLSHLAHLGVLILLFGVGLKLKFRQVLKPEVVGGGILQFALSSVLFVPVFALVLGLDWETALLVSMCLGFSSTVLAAKLLETKKELALFHGRTSIGILVIQDLIALAILAIWSDQTPNLGALSLLALPLLRPLLHKVVDLVGHGELLVLTSMLLAVVVGGGGFTAMGLSSELGALVVGAMLANHPRAIEISSSLLSLKELFLVCFFLSIGMSGLPSMESLTVALLASVLMPLKMVVFFGVLVAFKLRARSAFLSAISLASYSEFGLIVAAAVMPEWLVPLAITMSCSFVIAAPLNRYAHTLFERYEPFLNRWQRNTYHPDEQTTDLGRADALIFGMGRMGSAAYQFLVSEGYDPIGLDADMYKTKAHEDAGRNVFFADAEDSQFWKNVNLKQIKVAILAMDDIESKLISVRMLRKYGFDGPIISHALHEDHQERIRDAGATHTYLTMTQAGFGLAESAVLAMRGQEVPSDKAIAADKAA